MVCLVDGSFVDVRFAGMLGRAVEYMGIWKYNGRLLVNKARFYNFAGDL